MPELAEAEWYRKQWNPGLGDQVTRVALHTGKYIFRGTNTSSLGQHLVGREVFKIDKARKADAVRISRAITGWGFTSG